MAGILAAGGLIVWASNGGLNIPAAYTAAISGILCFELLSYDGPYNSGTP